MRYLRIKEHDNYTPKGIIPYVARAGEKYKYVLDESKLSEKELIENNLLFVVSVAKQYVGNGVPLEDLIQCGNYGLIEAAKLYDPTKGFRFITFAIYWIRKEILSEINSTKTVIKLPLNVRKYLSKINAFVNKYILTNGIFPSEEEIAKALPGLEPYISIYYFDKSFMSADAQFVSNSGHEQNFYDVFSSEDTGESWIEKEHTKEYVNNLLSKLSDRDREIIRKHYMEEKTCFEIADEFGLTRERIRQICERSLKILKGFNRTKKRKIRK